MTPEEEALQAKKKAMEQERLEYNQRVDLTIGELDQQISQSMLIANQGRRRLITTQGDELVFAVAEVLTEFGFGVQKMDESVSIEQTKFEDLRLTIPENREWEAIVEVRGYGNSVGQTADFQRLERFARHYQGEKGRWPSKKIYIINGQIELLPNQRQEPLAPAKDDIRVFGENTGLVIWSLDLFRAWKILEQVGPEVIKRSIIESVGRWIIPKGSDGESQNKQGNHTDSAKSAID
jgi:hypothetical protein